MAREVRLAAAAQIAPGKMQRFDGDGYRLVIANVDGRFHAADDRCTHEEASLATGNLHGCLLKCPLHGSRFDLRDGRVLDDPAEEDLRIYPCRSDGDDVIVELD
ncbi:MAG: non-heme iron oxygenase ferredoxin subunit [Chromatiales bacterium]|nr:non-heme iron oxygenase ferredoxin subunit [Chromatiales bacterium]